MKLLKKLRIILWAISLIINCVPPANAAEIRFEVPKLQSFIPSSEVIDIGSEARDITFTLTVSHPIGIVSTRTTLYLTSQDGRIELSTFLIRQNKFEVSSEPVKFSGTLRIETNTPTGLYEFRADPISGAMGENYKSIPISSIFRPEKFSKFLSGETAIQIRKFGKLNLTTKTFVGPSYASETYITDSAPVEYNKITPIFRKNELYNPYDYFVLRIPNTKLRVESFTNNVCTMENDKLRFNSVGTCRYRIFSEPNDDYISTSIILSSEIQNARIRPRIVLPSVSNRNVNDAQKQLETYIVTDDLGRVADITIKTPEICTARNEYRTIYGSQIISILSGGTCKIDYNTPESSSYLSSETFSLIFEIEKNEQKIISNIPESLLLSQKSLTLKANSTSGLEVNFLSKSPIVCKISSNNLNIFKPGICLIEIVQAGNSNYRPVNSSFQLTVIDDLANRSKSNVCNKKQSKKLNSRSIAQICR